MQEALNDSLRQGRKWLLISGWLAVIAGTTIATAPAITASQPETISHLRPCRRLSLSASCIRHLRSLCDTNRAAR